MRWIDLIKLEDFETSHSLGGASYTTRDIDLNAVARGWAGLQKPMDLGGCVSEERGYGEGVGSTVISLLSWKEQGSKGLFLSIRSLIKQKSNVRGSVLSL